MTEGAPSPRPTAMGKPATPGRVRSRAQARLCAAAETGRVRVGQRGMHVVRGPRAAAASRGLSPGRGPSGVRLYGKGPGFSSGWVRGHTPRALESRAHPRPGRGTSRLEPECPTLPARELDGYAPPPRGAGSYRKCVRGRGASPAGLYVAQLGSEMRSVSVETGCRDLGVCLRRDWRGLGDAETRIDHSQLF